MPFRHLRRLAAPAGPAVRWGHRPPPPSPPSSARCGRWADLRAPAPTLGASSSPAGFAAPTAPGSLGVPIHAAEAQSYVTALRQWVAQRRADLGEVDSAILRLSPSEQTAITTDLTVALTFWKAINDRLTLLETTFDGGRVGPKEAERLSTLIHGRLDSNTSSTSRYRRAARSRSASRGLSPARLPDPDAAGPRVPRPGRRRGISAHHRARAAAERIRDQLPLVPMGSERDAAAEQLARLDRRVADLVQRPRRGADVGGIIGPLEIDLAALERDLIVAAAERANAAQDRASTKQQIEELDARAAAIRALERACLETVTPGPPPGHPQRPRAGPRPARAPRTRGIPRAARAGLARARPRP